MKKRVIKRFYCEDMSNTIKLINTSKKHGKIIEIDGEQFEYVGDNMLYCLKTSRIKKLEN